MTMIENELQAYEDMRTRLEIRSFGKWIVVRDRELVGTYDDFQEAAGDAVRRFGRGPYLIRQVGAPPVTLPASVVYGSPHESSELRLQQP